MKKMIFFFPFLVGIALPLLSANAASSDPKSDKSQLAETESAGSKTEETRGDAKKSDSPVKQFAQGVKQVAYEGPKDFTKETVEQLPKKPPIVGVVEGVNQGTQKLLDHTVKGAYKVATLGTSELEYYEVEEPEKGSDETTKIKISIPGT